MDAILNTVAQQPVYVLIFVGVMAFLYVMRQLSLASAVLAETMKAALALVTSGQQEASRQNERWLAAIAAMNDGFILAITGQTAAIAHQGARLDTVDTSVSSLPALAGNAAEMMATGKDTNEIARAMMVFMRAAGVKNESILSAMGLDIKIIAQQVDTPTDAGEQAVKKIAEKEHEIAAPEPAAVSVTA